jgi:HTH-type transcriptional regulator / antitoxin MqsA
MFEMENGMNTQEPCPLCGEGHVTEQVQEVETVYKGHKAMLPLHYKLCDHCLSDFAGAEESRRNKRAVLAFRKQVDGLLTGTEIAALRKQYGLTQMQAARLFGGGPVAFSKYENDDVAQSEAMDTLLRLTRRSAAIFWELVEEKGMSAEFMARKPVTTSRPQALRFAVQSMEANPAAAIYNPREFRKFTHEEAESQCKP